MGLFVRAAIADGEIAGHRRKASVLSDGRNAYLRNLPPFLSTRGYFDIFISRMLSAHVAPIVTGDQCAMCMELRQFSRPA
jgi:hypothetical protein